eukprot:353118-Chlamydomonas_euryale.AAC.1
MACEACVWSWELPVAFALSAVWRVKRVCGVGNCLWPSASPPEHGRPCRWLAGAWRVHGDGAFRMAGWAARTGGGRNYCRGGGSPRFACTSSSPSVCGWAWAQRGESTG